MKMPYEKVCQYCGDDFYTSRKTRQFCCNDCRFANTKKKKIVKNCVYCKNTFLASRKTQTFCNWECLSKERASIIKSPSLLKCKDGQKRSYEIKLKLKLTLNEKLKLLAKAEDLGLPLAVYIRAVILMTTFKVGLHSDSFVPNHL